MKRAGRKTTFSAPSASKMCHFKHPRGAKCTSVHVMLGRRTDRTTRIPTGVASPISTSHEANGCMFVKLRNAGNLNICPPEMYLGPRHVGAEDEAAVPLLVQPCRVLDPPHLTAGEREQVTSPSS